jgi:hypothetical protein
MKLVELLVWLVSGGGAGVASYWLWHELEEVIPILKKWSAKAKRYANLLLASLLGTVAFMAGVWMGYEATPEDVRAWIEAIFSAIALSIALSQIIHGERDLA